MSMKLELRAASNADRGAIQALVFGVLAEYGLKPDPGGTDLDLEDIEAAYFKPGGTFVVLTNESGAVAGTAGLCRVDDGTCELRKMYLARDARGMGYGRRLLEFCLKEASARGFKRITLETASVLKEAIALYEQHGFRKCAREHLAGRCDAAYELEVQPNDGGQICALDHVQLAMPPGRENEARLFYRDLLGLAEAPKPAVLAGKGGVWFECGEARVHLGVEKEFRPAKKAHPAFVVRGLEKLINRLREHNAQVEQGEALEGIERVHVFDPFGNRIELLEKNRK